MKIASIDNFRDVGGYATAGGGRVAKGRLYRCGHLADLTEPDRARLEGLGVKLIVDLRGPRDIEADGENVMPSGAELLNLPIGTAGADTEDLRTLLTDASPDKRRSVLGGGGAARWMERAASRLVTQHRRVFSKYLHRLADAGSLPALVHCTAGKDRTGWAVSALLLALGVSREDVIENYLRSNEHRVQSNQRALERYAQGEGTRAEDTEILRSLLEVQSSYIESSFAAVKKHFGSVEGYLSEGLQVSSDTLEALRRNFEAEPSRGLQ